MKVRTQAASPKASRLFTDREEPRAAFWQKYDLLRQEMACARNINVLTYYGIGGIGKSCLLKQLTAEMEERLPEARYVYFDFNICQERRPVLEALKNKLADRYKFQFPLFELGTYIYAKKVGEDPESPEIKKLTEKSPLLSLMLSVAENIPVVGVAAKVLSLADQGLAFLRTYLKQHQRELAQIEYMEADEIYEHLPYLFAQDMTHNLEAAEAPLVIFLDTYERVVNEMISVGAPLNHDLWIRGDNGIVQNIPNVLWVIAGREKLKWEKFNPEWKDALEQHILGDLSPTDSDQFLISAGVGGSQLRRDLYDLTNGTPVYLDLCVDQFIRLSQQGIVPDISMFGDNPYDLIERFVRYMDDTLKDIVYVLACMGQWTDQVLADIAGAVLPSFSLSTYGKVKDFSFVIQSDDDVFNIHQTVGETLVAHCPEGLRTRIVTHALDYFTARIKDGNVLSPDFGGHLRYVMQFGLMLHQEDAALLEFYKEQVDGYVQQLAEAGRFAQADTVFDLFWNRAEHSNHSPLYARALFFKAYLLSQEGNCRYSSKLSAEAVELCSKLLGEDHPDTLYALRVHADSLNELGQYPEAEALYRQALDKCHILCGENHEITLSVMNNLAGTLYSQHKYDEARKLQEQVLSKHRKLWSEDHPDTLTAMNNLAVTLGAQSRHEEARKLQEEVLSRRRQIWGEDHPSVFQAMNNLAATLGQLDQYEEARQLYEQALSRQCEALGENHPHVLTITGNLVTLLLDLSQFEEARELTAQLLSRSRTIMGEDHPDTLKVMNLLAFSLVCLSRDDEAQKLYEQILQKLQSTLGEDHPDTLYAMKNLADNLYSLSRYKEAQTLYEQLYDKYRTILGEQHPNTLMIILHQSAALYNLSQYETSAELLKQALPTYCAILGEDHPDTLNAMHNLASALYWLSRYEEARELMERIVEKQQAVCGEDHPETLTSMKQLARILEKSGCAEEGQKLNRQIEHLEASASNTPS